MCQSWGPFLFAGKVGTWRTLLGRFIWSLRDISLCQVQIHPPPPNQVVLLCRERAPWTPTLMRQMHRHVLASWLRLHSAVCPKAPLEAEVDKRYVLHTSIGFLLVPDLWPSISGQGEEGFRLVSKRTRASLGWGSKGKTDKKHKGRLSRLLSEGGNPASACTMGGQ